MSIAATIDTYLDEVEPKIRRVLELELQVEELNRKLDWARYDYLTEAIEAIRCQFCNGNSYVEDELCHACEGRGIVEDPLEALENLRFAREQGL